ncbi:hypothetical protein N7492_002503 [Penicillium capsulatum]|uniref:Auxin efflux carrier n=1 Tax=Penicillium capsulatum TaxID=69766 RepID=A0A9W9IHQ2_9EURO|nr:hypothetical protein N7492_002503 [Penicillium capsulatum]
MATDGLLQPFLGALQACVCVLLTMCYGVVARRLRLIHDATINDMSGLAVKLFLPALIVVHLGQQLDLGTALNYVPSLDSVGSLRLILGSEDIADGIERAQSYFLVCAVVSKTIAYVVGPKMLHEGNDTSSESSIEESRSDTDEQLTETTSLLPQRAQKVRNILGSRIQIWTERLGSIFPRRVKQELMAPFGSPFADVAICCTLLGAVLGLVPGLHRAFFSRVNDGGVFQAWLTTSIRNIGRLFPTLQIFMVGCKLGVTFERMVAEDDSGRIPMRAIATIILVRLVLWPALSISLIYGLAKTNILGNDPMLWFSMMLMPAGPPALVISGLAELAQASEADKMAIAKTVAVCETDAVMMMFLTILDHVCAFAIGLFRNNGRSKGIRGCFEGLSAII